ncbi:MAG: hypothetical protein GY810_13950 [Aureispira sp.]|nr:hypothetical protein [Aureispira sp.]
MRSSIFLLFMASCLGYFQANGQQQEIMNQTQQQSVLYTYDNATGTYGNIIKKVIKSIAPNDYSNSHFELFYTQNIKVYKGSGNQVEVKLDFQNIYIGTAPTYQNFTFTNELMPSKVNVGVSLQRFSGTVLGTKQFNNILITAGNSGISKYTYTDTLNTTDYNVVISSIEFVYDSKVSTAVRNRTDAIAEYEKANQDFQTMDNAVVLFNTTNPNPDSVEWMLTEVERYEKDYNKVKKLKFWERLGLNVEGAFDPLSIKTMDTQFFNRLVQRKNELELLKARLHELYYDKAKVLYMENKVEESKQEIEKSLKRKNDYAPTHLLLAQISFDEGKISDAIVKLKETMEKYNPEQQTIQDATTLGDQIKTHYIQAGATNSAQGKHRLALMQLDTAADLCKNTKNYNCNAQDIENIKRNVVTSWYNNELTMVRTHLNNGQNSNNNGNYPHAIGELDLAQVAADTATSILTTYGAYISDDKGINQIKTTLSQTRYNSYYNYGEQSLSNNQLDTALVYAQKAEELAKSQGILGDKINGSMDLVYRVQLQIYNRYITTGDQLHAEAKYIDAIWNFDAAKQLDTKYNFTAKGQGQDVDTKLKASAKAEVLAKAQANYNNTDNTTLRPLLKDVLLFAEKYAILGDLDVSNAINQLQDKVCSNARDILYKGAMDQLLASRQTKDYIQAKASMLEAEEILKEYPNCGIDNAQLLELSPEVMSCGTYQETLKDVEGFEEKRTYKQAVEKLELARQMYLNDLVSNNLPKNKKLDIYSFLMSETREAYVYEGAAFFSDQQDNEKSFELLKRALKRKYDKRKTKRLQEKLGTWKAEETFKKSKKWKDGYAEVVGDMKKELAFMKKTFRKKWNNMK